MTGLRQCTRCGYYARRLDQAGVCGICAAGWRHCQVHSRLEWDPGDGQPDEHARVTTGQAARLGGAR